MDKISSLRKNIDEIDRQIIDSLIKRKTFSESIITLKKSLNISVFDKQREIEIIDSLKKEFSDIINPHLIENVLREILFYSKSECYMLNTDKSHTLIDLLNYHPFLIAGPCTIESVEQIEEIAMNLNRNGVRLLRGGAFKPRTSPDSFQGLEDVGLKIMRQVADKLDMFTVTEFTDSRQVNELYDMADVIQIGSRNMFSYGFLKQIGKATAKDQKPVLLKRSFTATLKEFLYSAQYIVNEGNPNVILCLRGIRTFEQIDSQMRNTPDLASILELKEMTDLKIVFDPSHACGDARFVVPTSIAALNLGASGLLIETHTNPENAVTDGKQSIQPAELERVIDYINRNF